MNCVWSAGSCHRHELFSALKLVKIVNEDNAKVLIIDLDNDENGVLSFIDTDKFYRESYFGNGPCRDCVFDGN